MNIKPALVLLAAIAALITPARAFDLGTNSEPIVVTFPEVAELREQLATIQRANEESAAKWDALMNHNAALSNRLSDMQGLIAAQREREAVIAKESQTFNYRVLIGSSTAVIVVLLLSYFFQLRCFNRVVELSRSMNALPPASPALLPESTQSNSHLLAAMKVLEERIQQLQSAAHGNGSVKAGAPEQLAAKPRTASEAPPLPSSASLFLEKGQTLLDMDRLQEALNCFEEAASLERSNGEAQFKKGLALERMNRLEPALAAYEEAIRLNPKKTLAYVYKARVLQGLQRFDEALSVYDSAMGKNAPRRDVPVFTS